MTNESTRDFIAVDDPAPGVRRITLNRPEKRNAINNGMRAELFAALEAADVDDAVHVTIVRGAGPCFSSGYDLNPAAADERPYYTAGGDGSWSRHVTEGWVRIWDLAKPVIAQVHGYAMAGGTELAAACDLLYVTPDATIGYPAIRTMSSPDLLWQPWFMGMRRAMEALLTGDSMTGTEAVEAGYANRAFPEDQLEAEVLAIAERIAQIPGDLLTLNKRTVHRAMEAMGMRTGLRATTELQALGLHQRSSKEYMPKLREVGVKQAVHDRDAPFGDGRAKP